MISWGKLIPPIEKEFIVLVNSVKLWRGGDIRGSFIKLFVYFEV